MICVRLMGGLGNQMFQYAMGRALSLERGTGLALDLSALGQGRDYELGCFELDVTLTRVKTRSRFSRLLVRGRPKVVTERRLYQYDSELLKSADGSVLVGYWNNEGYFKDHADLIRGDFQFTTSPTREIDDLAAEIPRVASVALHVRRGDYVSDPATRAYHGALGLDYYHAAIKAVSDSVERPHFFVFSDDPGWVKAELTMDHPTTYVNVKPATAAWEDLQLMTLCRHHVIANSTFSWWGAWLGANPRQIVVAPSRWLADPAIDTGDVTPPGWIRL